MSESSTPAQEWKILQQGHEQYEKAALWIKLTAVVLCFVSLAVVIDLLLVGILIMVLWLQEAILRTSQSRLGNRLVILETMLRDSPQREAGAFQLHTEWLAARGGTMALLGEYGRNAFRATVAFPYVVLLVILLAALSIPPV